MPVEAQWGLVILMVIGAVVSTWRSNKSVKPTVDEPALRLPSRRSSCWGPLLFGTILLIGTVLLIVNLPGGGG